MRRKAAFDRDHGAEQSRPCECEVGREMAAHRAADIDSLLNLERLRHRLDEINSEALRQRIALSPPGLAERRQRLAVIRQIVGDEAELRGQFLVFEDVAPLTSIAARRVLHENGRSFAGLLEIDAIFDAFHSEMDIAAGDWTELGRHDAHSFSTVASERRISPERRIA